MACPAWNRCVNTSMKSMCIAIRAKPQPTGQTAHAKPRSPASTARMVNMFTSDFARRSIHKLWLSAALLSAIAVAPAATAAELVLEQSALVVGAQTTVTPFTVAGAGTLSVTLTDLAWPERLATLSFAFSDAQSVLGSMAAPGTQQ